MDVDVMKPSVIWIRFKKCTHAIEAISVPLAQKIFCAMASPDFETVFFDCDEPILLDFLAHRGNEQLEATLQQMEQ